MEEKQGVAPTDEAAGVFAASEVQSDRHGFTGDNQACSHLFLWNRGLTGLICYMEVVNSERSELVTSIKDQKRL